MFQKVIIAGNLGGDPELRSTQSGQSVCSFSVATSRKWTSANGELRDETVWFRVSVWGKQAETCHRFLRKGRPVLVEGRLTCDAQTGGPRIWTDNQGQPRASYELSAIDVRFLGGREEGGGGGGGGGGGYSQGGGGGYQQTREGDPQSSGGDSGPGPMHEDEMPF